MPHHQAGGGAQSRDDAGHRADALQQQVKSNTLEQFSASPDLHQQFIDAVLGSMESSQDLSTQILNNHDIFQKLLAELVPIIYDEMKKTA